MMMIQTSHHVLMHDEEEEEEEDFYMLMMTQQLSCEHAGSSLDDQSSVAGREDTARDQTVSSPLHPSASPARLPTPDPPQADSAPLAHELKPAPKATALSQGGGGAERGAPWEASQQGCLPGQGSGRGPEGRAKGSLQGAKSTAVGPTKGQRPSTAPVSPVAGPGKLLKPTRCQKCHTCRHKQLKKQCLRNKAGSPSPSPLQRSPPKSLFAPPPPPPP